MKQFQLVKLYPMPTNRSSNGRSRSVPKVQSGISGLDEITENAPLSEVLTGIRGGEIRDGKTVVAILYMARFILAL